MKSRGTSYFPKIIFDKPELCIDFCELALYNIGKGGDTKMFQKPVESCSTRIKKALSIRNMKQSELCEKTKIPKSALSEYIKGIYEPKQDRVFAISQALNVDPVWLMGFDVPMEQENKKRSPHEPTLTEGEKLVLDLFRQIPVDQQPMVLAMIKAALCTGK